MLKDVVDLSGQGSSLKVVHLGYQYTLQSTSSHAGHGRVLHTELVHKDHITMAGGGLRD